MLINYLRKQKMTILLFVLLGAVVLVINSLSGGEFTTGAYSVCVCTFFVVCFGLVDFLKYRNKLNVLMNMEQTITFNLSNLPIPEGDVEEEYTRLLEILYDDRRKSVSEYAAQYENLSAYYTTWAHQIKTPIQAMRLLLQAEGGRPELESELIRIEQYVDMVLTYLKLGNDDYDFVFRKISVDRIVKDTLKKCARQFFAAHLSLNYEEVNITTVSDEKWLQFVVEQILSNSLKYTKAGSIHIYSDAPGVLCIADTGIGIDPSDLPRVFDSGFTGYNGREDKKATGIGLYLCKCTMDRLGHGISIESKVGEGTTVRLFLAQNKTDTRD